MRLIFRILLLAALLAPIMAIRVRAQSLDSLRREREAVSRQLEHYSVQLDSLTKISLTSDRNIKSIGQKIAAQREHINHTRAQIDSYNRQMRILKTEIDTLDSSIASAKARYADLVRAYQRFANSNNTWYYILTASSFHAAFMRTQYMSRYAQYARNTLNKLNATKQGLDTIYAQFNNTKRRLDILGEDLQTQLITLQNDLILQEQYSAKLTDNKTTLLNQILIAKEQNELFDREIQRLIAIEAQRQAAVASNIKEAKGGLPWPAKNFTVKSEFGSHPHPMFKEVTINNNGVDLLVDEKDTRIFPVSKGVVARVILIPGNNISVIVKHGDVATIYSNLQEVNVKKDQEIQTETVIGSVYRGPGLNNLTLHFELWVADQLQNPAEWLKNL